MLEIYIVTFLLLDYVSTSVEEERRWTTIPCQAKIEQGVKYRKISWYKVEEGSDVLTGLVLKDLQKNITVLYKNADHSYEVGENNSLLVPSAAGEICGIYRCTLWPPLGHYIQKGNYKHYSAVLRADFYDHILKKKIDDFTEKSCTASQWKVQQSRKDEVAVMSHLKFFSVPCVLLFCAVTIFIINIKLMKKTKEKEYIKETLVPTDEKV